MTSPQPSGDPTRWARVHRFAVLGALVALFVILAVFGQARADTRIQRVVSPNGVVAWLVEEHAIPIVSIEIGIRGGAMLEGDDQAGLASVFASMLDEGAGDLDATAFAKRGEMLAVRLGFGAGRDTFTVSATMLADNRDESLALLRLALMEPRFDPEPLARVQAQFASSFRERAVDPGAIASDAWMGAMFPGDPYGRPRIGTPETVAAITSDDLRAAAPLFLNRANMKIGVVGAITADELGPLLDELVGDLPEGAPITLPPLSQGAPTGVQVVPFETPQSTVIFGHAGITRDDPDYIAAFVMNYILGGGGFASRLTTEIRVKRGLTYGVYSYLSPLDRAGLYLGGVATSNDRVAESLELVAAEWARMAEGGATADELDAAKRYLTGAYPLRFDSNGKIAGFLVGAQLENLGIDYIDKRNDLIRAVTLDDIRHVAARLLRPAQLFYVVVGQPVGLESTAN